VVGVQPWFKIFSMAFGKGAAIAHKVTPLLFGIQKTHGGSLCIWPVYFSRVITKIINLFMIFDLVMYDIRMYDF
jgi:hypothetical protein